MYMLNSSNLIAEPVSADYSMTALKAFLDEFRLVN